jgi:N-acetylneuraminic acid mutarotase
MGGVLLDTVSLSGLGLATNYSYLVFTENTNLTTTPIKFAPPPFAVTTATNEFFYLPEQSLDSLAGQDALGTWTLEIQDDRAGATNNATLVSWQLRFNFASFAHALTPEFLIPNPPDIIMDELTTLTVTNTATETDTNKTLIYSLSISVDTNTMTINGWPLNFAGTVPAPVISTNGIITWIPSEAQGPGVYTITTVVAVYGVPSATTNNSFTVTVNEVNVPPGFHFPTNTTVFNIYESFPFTANCVAMDLDVPANPLTFALVSGPTGLTVSTDGAINWTPTLIGTNTVKISVTDTNIFALTNSFSVTNSFTIVVTTMTNPPTGPLETARGEHTATLLPNGKVLIAGGMNAVGFLSSAELYDPATGTWTNTGSLNTARGEHTATLLPNGKVLITGGINKTSGTFLSLSSSELYDPATGTWTATTGSLTTGRYNHTATLLPNGKVLVTGGFNFASLITLSSSELYDPATGTWTPTGSMNTARKTHTATLLPNGKVLVAGGGSSSAELYDPNSGGGTWTLTGSMTDARSDGFTATLLPNGKVLVVGGAGTNGYLSSAELYDPAAGMWTNTGSMTIGRYAINATLLPNGKVLVAGGYGTGGIYLSSSELYDPNIGGGTWTVTALTLSIGRQYPTATLLPNGQVLLAGGFGSSGSLSSAELYDPNIGGGTWTATTNMLNSARAYHTATLLTNGQVLVTGGYNGGTNSELYNPVSGWTNTGSLNTARGEHTATLLPRGKVLVVGGYNSSTNSDVDEHRLVDHRTLCSHCDIAAQWKSAGRGRSRLCRLSFQRGVV